MPNQSELDNIKEKTILPLVSISLSLLGIHTLPADGGASGALPCTVNKLCKGLINA